MAIAAPVAPSIALPPVVAQTLDSLSLAAINSEEVQGTQPGTVGRRQAVRRYVIAHWPARQHARAELVSVWFDLWTQLIRRQTLTCNPEPCVLVY